MVQFEDQDYSHSTLKYGLSKVLHMSQHTDTELPLPSAKKNKVGSRENRKIENRVGSREENRSRGEKR